jgi:5'-deoxynucleotidase YfbR-like HD superfamily hydrolase
MAKADESQPRSAKPGKAAEEMEARTAKAAERLVSRDSFGELLARTTENAMAMTKIGFDAMDLVVRNLRLAGRRDVTNLGRQLARTEDKLEMVLQEVERLRQELDGARASTRGQSGRSRGQGGRTRRQQR